MFQSHGFTVRLTRPPRPVGPVSTMGASAVREPQYPASLSLPKFVRNLPGYKAPSPAQVSSDPSKAVKVTHDRWGPGDTLSATPAPVPNVSLTLTARPSDIHHLPSSHSTARSGDWVVSSLLQMGKLRHRRRAP